MKQRVVRDAVAAQRRARPIDTDFACDVERKYPKSHCRRLRSRPLKSRAACHGPRPGPQEYMQSCPCCQRPAHRELLPNTRRLGAALAQLSPSRTTASSAANATPPKEPFLPLKEDRLDPTRHGRPTGSYASFEGLRDPKDPEKHAPFRIKHSEGLNAEPTAGQSGSHGGPATVWMGYPVAQDEQFQNPWCFHPHGHNGARGQASVSISTVGARRSSSVWTRPRSASSFATERKRRSMGCPACPAVQEGEVTGSINGTAVAKHSDGLT